MLRGPSAHHALTVLRFRVGHEIILCDGMGVDYVGRMVSYTDKPATITFSLLSSTPSIPEPPVQITLYQGIPKGDKMEWIIEKCIEVGVHKIVAVCTSRSVVKIKDAIKKKERFMRVAESAASQCMRGIIPEIVGPIHFGEAIEYGEEDSTHIIAYENEKEASIKSALSKMRPQPVSLWIGPEGGFAEDEIAALKSKKAACTVSLGSRILRTETAGIVALSQILCIWDSD